MPRLPTGPDRLAAQFVLARLHDALTRLLAPIIPHTAEESWDYCRPLPTSPPACTWRNFPNPIRDGTTRPRRTLGRPARSSAKQILRALEGLRKSKQIGSAQEAR